MSTKQTKSRIMEALSAILIQEGYKYRKSSYDYIRRTNYGFDQISLNGISPSRGMNFSHIPLFEGGIILSIRFDVIESSLLPLGLIAEGYSTKSHVTAFRVIKSGFHPFDQHRDKTISISHARTRQDENRAIDQISAMLTSDGLSWFCTYSNLNCFEREINAQPDFKESHLFNNPEGRIYRGVSAAAHCRGIEAAEQIANDYIAATHSSFPDLNMDSRSSLAVRAISKLPILLDHLREALSN